MFYEVLAMIRTLGIPTWFHTLSEAYMKWPEVIQVIARQYGTSYTEDEVLQLSWTMKSMWLRSNPVTAVRMFQYRLDTFVTTFLKSSSKPIGEVVEYVIQIEFQVRGSPHVHTLIWIQMRKMLQHSLISMCHAHYLKLMKNFAHLYKACKFTIIHKHAEEKEAVDSTTQSHITFYNYIT